MATLTADIAILRDLAAQYAALARDPVQDRRRALWRQHFSRRPTGVPVLATFGMWNVWCRQVWGDAQLQCQDTFYREYERRFRMGLFQHTVGDDTVLEPWVTVAAHKARGWRQVWGVKEGNIPAGVEGGAWHFDPPVKDWDDLAQLSPPPHAIDEAATATDVGKLGDAIGDLLPIEVDRGPLCLNFMADISTNLAGLRGLEQMMLDMYESPAELHRLVAFMRDGILANQAAAEAAGDFTLARHANQAVPYCEELEPPQAHSGPRQRRQLWGFFAAQEFALVGPAQHDEFLLQYQLPIMRQFGLIHYGCCEDLTQKIDMLRQVPNLRSIAVTPRADVRRCAEQIGTDYIISWRPNPTDMVCAGFEPAKIRKTLREGLAACRGGFVHLHLKDVETVEGEPDRLARWVRIVREVAGG